MLIVSEAKRLTKILYVASKYFVFHRFLRKYRKLPKWVRLRLAFEDLGATFIKLGQFLAIRFDLLSYEYCAELSLLFDEVPPFSYQKVREIIREELGKDPSELFLRFDPQPLASASLGQVHLAALHSGQTVAVKVQRPDIARVINLDLRILSRLVRLVDTLSLFRRIRARSAYDDFAQWTTEEFNYNYEAANADTLRDNSSDDPYVRFPVVYRQYSTASVITTEFLEGVKVTKLLKIVANHDDATPPSDWLSFEEALRLEEIDLRRIAQTLVESFLEQAFVHGFFHADPHPANLIILPENVVGYVDFGLVGVMDEDYRRKMMTYMEAVAEKDIERAFRAFTEMVAVTADTDLVGFEREFKRNLRGWASTVSNGGHDFRQKSIARLTFQNLRMLRDYSLVTRMDVLAFYKTMMTVDSVTLQLVPGFDSAEAVREFFDKLRCRVMEQKLDPENVYNRLQYYWASYFATLNRLASIVDQADKGTLMFTVKSYDVGKLRDVIQKDLSEGIRHSLVMGSILFVIGTVVVGVLYLAKNFPGVRDYTPLPDYLIREEHPGRLWTYIASVVVAYLFYRFNRLRRKNKSLAKEANVPIP